MSSSEANSRVKIEITPRTRKIGQELVVTGHAVWVGGILRAVRKTRKGADGVAKKIRSAN